MFLYFHLFSSLLFIPFICTYIHTIDCVRVLEPVEEAPLSQEAVNDIPTTLPQQSVTDNDVPAPASTSMCVCMCVRVCV